MRHIPIAIPFWACLLVASGVSGCDQATKFRAVGALTDAFEPGDLGLCRELAHFATLDSPAPRAVIEVVEGLWRFRYVENPGLMFSLHRFLPPAVVRPLALLAPVALLVVVLVWLWRMEPTRRGERVALALVVGGGIGNLVDRVRLGYVIDFIDWHWYERFTWPTFNIADAALVVGVALLLVVSFWRDRRRKLAAAG